MRNTHTGVCLCICVGCFLFQAERRQKSSLRTQYALNSLPPTPLVTVGHFQEPKGTSEIPSSRWKGTALPSIPRADLKGNLTNPIQFFPPSTLPRVFKVFCCISMDLMCLTCHLNLESHLKDPFSNKDRVEKGQFWRKKSGSF